jgi:serine/threonine protein kinase
VPGIGEVYAARDHDKQRDVTFRVLRVDFAAAPDRLARFGQESQAAAHLFHPNILTVHDVGTDAEAAYIVSEPMEGRTLQELLEAGALPAETGARYAADLASGLAAAHASGIVHRDLTPANILVTPHGGAKIVGFGLAVATQQASVPVSVPLGTPRYTSPEQLVAATRTASALATGVPLGRLRYVSPEQLLGSPVDQRSDMFAFGAIVHEMLTGAPAFDGGTLDTMMAMMASDPRQPSAADVPGLARIVEACLKEAPESRPSAKDVVVALRALQWDPAESDEVVVSATPSDARQGASHSADQSADESADRSADRTAPRASRHGVRHSVRHGAGRFWRVAVVLGAVALAAAVGFWLLRVTQSAEKRTSTATSSAAPMSTTSQNTATTSQGGSPSIPSETQPVSPAPALSPEVLDAGPRLVWFDRAGVELSSVGTPGDYGDLSLSPDGTQAAAGLRAPGSESADIWVFDAVSGVGHRLTSDPADDIAPVWSADGRRVVFASLRGGSYDIYARAADETGTDTAVVEGTGDQIPTDWSSDGRYLIYQTDEPDVVAGANRDLWARPLPAGRPFAFLRTGRDVSHATFSPDGSRVAFVSSEGGRDDVYVAAFPRYDGRRLVSVAGGAWPRWSRDGDEVFYLDPENQLMAASVDRASTDLGVAAPRALFQLRTRRDRGYPYDVSADGQWVLVNVVGDRIEGAVGDAAGGTTP